MEISTRIKSLSASVPLINYMAARFTYRSSEAWGELIDSGAIQVNGQLATRDYLVNLDDVLTTILPDPDPPSVNFDYSIVYEDEWLLGVNKPANLRVHGRGRFIHANLIHHLRHLRTPNYPTADLVNRLDANTSGLVLIAKTKEMMSHLQALFRERTVSKRYAALVHGVPQPEQGIISEPIGRLPSLEGVYRYGNGPGVEKLKVAETRYALVEQFAQQTPLDQTELGLVQLWPRTGRTHQLRVHLAYIGHPIVGDMLYQLSDEAYLDFVREPQTFAAPLLGRQALHCEAYTFYHPFLQQEMTIEAPLAKEIEALIQEMREER